MLSLDSPNAFGYSRHRTTHPVGGVRWRTARRRLASRIHNCTNLTLRGGGRRIKQRILKLKKKSPRRGGLSPRKKSPVSNVHNVPSSISQLLNSIDYETRSSDILDAIPEREWRLLAALARKREEDDEREKLADQFRKLWQKEKEERELVEAETQDQYQRYINEKRREEKNWQEFRQYQMSLESQLRRRQLIDCIKHKEQRSANLRAYIDDQKTGFMIDKALEEEARAQLAADRRTRLGEAEQFRKHVELIDTQRRADNARKRRTAMLRDASQRVAISNALSSWETTLLRQELSALDAARRAHHAAHAALTDARSVRLMRTRDARRRRARRMAAVTEQMREIIRSGRRS
ncbi:trichohyalin-like isoform X1 [Trichoplusia ni]|uniref:Trichohyalin-like isoform X1 n=1 Tax=Trichoplusia ni TaxID=7111 RepID=A0A7E5WIC3_TRINI|nr:trichohyalin-like isoform X1 [Trichoplusia ni]